MATQIIGLDVSKAFLDGYLAGTRRSFRVANDAEGIARLAEELTGTSACLIVMEASGGYERLAHRALTARGLPTAIVNPKRVRDFARGTGREAKTDRIDARVIAHYGEVQKPAPVPLPTPAREQLAELLACRRQVTEEISVRRQQLGQFQTALARQRLEKMLALLREEKDALEALLRETVQADAALAADCELLRTMPGCGPILAMTLVAEMPELGHLDRRKVAALAGLAPIAKDSGTRQGRRAIKGGRGQVRHVLYMAAVATLAAKSNPFQASYRRLVDRGKAEKLALTAIMRKMLVTLNALLRTRSRWKNPDQK